QRVGDRGGDWRCARFSDAGRRLGRRYDVHFDFGHLVDAQHLVVVEVRLHDLAVVQRNFAHEQRRQAIADAAFHLRNDNIRVDGDTAVEGAYDALDLETSILLQ